MSAITSNTAAPIPEALIVSPVAQKKAPASSSGPKRKRLFTAAGHEDNPVSIDSDDEEKDPDYEATPGRSKKKKAKTDAPTTKSAVKQASTSADPPAPKKMVRMNRSKDTLYDMIDSRTADIARLEGLLAKERARASKHSKAKKTGSTTIGKKNVTLHELREKLDVHKQKIIDLEAELRSLQQQLREKEDIIQEFQASSLQELDKKHGMCDSDGAIENMISKTLRLTKRFSAEHAVNESKRLDTKARGSVLRMLKDANMPTLLSGDHGDAAVIHGLIPPKVLLNALLNRFLVEMLLADPFTAAAGCDDLSMEPMAAATAFRAVYAAAQSSHASAAHFRVTTAASLLPNGRGPYNADHYDVVDSRTRSLANFIVDLALRTFSPLLTSNEKRQQSREEDLLSCVQEFIRIGIRLHAQYPFVWAGYQNKLKHERFSHAHEKMELHPGMMIKDDGDDGTEGLTAQQAGIAGCTPDLIIEPLILRSGDDVGEVWDFERVVKPARVWICNPGEIQHAESAATKQKSRSRTVSTSRADRSSCSVPEAAARDGDESGYLATSNARRSLTDGQIQPNTVKKVEPPRRKSTSDGIRIKKEPNAEHGGIHMKPNSGESQAISDKRKSAKHSERGDGHAAQYRKRKTDAPAAGETPTPEARAPEKGTSTQAPTSESARQGSKRSKESKKNRKAQEAEAQEQHRRESVKRDAWSTTSSPEQERQH